jgi:hypothetical protein
MSGHICVSRCRPNAHIAFEGRVTASALVRQLEDGEVRVEKQFEFWREADQEWVPNVNIRRSECSQFGGVDPTKWRVREITTATHVGEWRDGKR